MSEREPHFEALPEDPQTPLGQALLEWVDDIEEIYALLENGTTREKLLFAFKVHWADGEWVTRLLRDAAVDMSEVKKKP